MDPHTHDHKQLTMNTSSSWGEGSSILLDNMASSMDHHQHYSNIFLHDQQRHHAHALLPTSLDHHLPVWTSCSTNETNYIVVPFSNSNYTISSPRPSSPLRFLGNSSYAAQHHVALPTHKDHEVTLDHHLFSQVLREEDEQEDKDEHDNNKDPCVNVNEEDEGLDHEEEEEELSAMKEMMYKIAAMQPVDIDPSTIRKPKRRNVRISDDPQSVAARHRRERISEKMRILQRLVPGGTKMDTASMLDEAIRYVKFLKRQIKHLQQDQNHPLDPASLKSSSLHDTTSSFNHHQYLSVTMANKNQLVRVAAEASHSTATNNHNCGTLINSALLHHHEKPVDIPNICSNSNNKVHQCMDNNSVVMHSQQQMDVFSQQVSGFMDRR